MGHNISRRIREFSAEPLQQVFYGNLVVSLFSSFSIVRTTLTLSPLPFPPPSPHPISYLAHLAHLVSHISPISAFSSYSSHYPPPPFPSPNPGPPLPQLLLHTYIHTRFYPRSRLRPGTQPQPRNHTHTQTLVPHPRDFWVMQRGGMCCEQNRVGPGWDSGGSRGGGEIGKGRKRERGKGGLRMQKVGTPGGARGGIG